MQHLKKTHSIPHLSEEPSILMSGATSLIYIYSCALSKMKYSFLDEGDQCPVTRFVGGPPPTVKCKDGLICQENEENIYVCTRPRPRTCNN
ncbi:hypothetical protein HNY73_013126 [Argiope bruennichi]|uniref:Uncharacterized protein n=1 Tax=Argiope bruennichi TaxID=94029 RepID=A0A8T0EX26_ARGBR|nr:hypothetical protein HNY73_013126 [Argiope bruennichi]